MDQKPENFYKAYDYAVYLLGLHLRTEGELRAKLLAKKYDESTASSVLQELKASGFLDDERYAEIYADNLKKYKLFGYYGIKKKLMEKKLPQNIISRVLEEALPVEEEIKIAKRFLSKPDVIASAVKQSKLRKDRRGPLGLAMAKKQKLAQRLKSRGFRTEIIVRLLF